MNERPELGRAIARYRSVPPRAALAGTAGEKLGRSLGSSVDFADFRDYVPGDDPRRLDWRAFARTDRLQTRLYREESAPTLEILVDGSASMATTPEKEQAARDLVQAFAAWAPIAGARARRLYLGGGDLSPDAAPEFQGAAVPLEPPRLPLRPRALRVVVSDFLVPEDPAPFLRRIAAGGAELAVVQLLDPWEASPATDGALQLIDVETGRRRDLRLTKTALRSYAERLGRLRAAVEAGARAVGGRYAFVVAASPEAMFAGPLLGAGITEPR